MRYNEFLNFVNSPLNNSLSIKKFFLVSSIITIYILIQILLSHFFKLKLIHLSAIPVLLGGLLLGIKGGVITSISTLLINLYLLNIETSITSFITIILFGIIIGTTGDLIQQLRKEITKQKLIEEKLRKSEEKYRFLFNNVQDGVFVVQNGKLQHINEALAKRTGYKIDEIIGKPFHLFIAPESLENTVEIYNRRLKGKPAPSEYEICILHKNKKNRIYFNVNTGIFTYQGKKNIIGTVKDITERKKREKELQILFETASLLNRTLDIDKILEKITDAVDELIGFNHCVVFLINKEKNTITPKIAKGIGKEYWKNKKTISIEKYAHNLIKLGVCWKKPFYFKNLMESNFPEEIRKNFIKKYNFKSCLCIPIKVNNEVLGNISIMTRQIKEFTEEEMKLLLTFAEQAGLAIIKAKYFNLLKESEKKYRTIFEKLKDAIFIITPDGKILDINPAGIELFGYSSKELLMKINAKDLFFYPVDWNKYREEMNKREEIKNREFLLKNKHGKRIIAHITSNVLKDEKGNIIAYEGIIRDFTEKRKLETQLTQSQKLESIGRLTAGVAHDFNNILTTLMGYAELIDLNPSIPSEIKEKLKIIISQSEHASTLIRQLLDFSRTSVTEKHVTDILPYLKETVKLLRRTIPENIEIEFNYIPDEYWVEIDVNQLQQVITNLAINSYDAMPEGGVFRIEVSKKHYNLHAKKPLPQMNEGEWVILTFKDTGVGIAPEHLPYIFEPFFTTKPKGKGTGLGLSQVYGIIKQYNGYIKVESEIGKGTTFTIYLPSFKNLRTSNSRRREEEKLTQGRGEMILVVEDDKSILELMKRTLEKLDYRIITATNGEEALNCYEKYKEKLSLIISDMVMPGLSGLELIETLRAKDPSIKIILVTGYPVEERINRILKRKKTSWIQKPFKIQEFSKIVRETLENTN